VYIDAFINRRFDWAAVQSVVTFIILTLVSVVYARFYFRQERD
jgi:ABC-type sugar transport system permease subunit